ncbi:MAG TPA: DUF2786 domain-containing protein, partial [Frankiaceae bacterium]|nr:DUF2786 domain-containing protein [Frankiaceae bacterium]
AAKRKDRVATDLVAVVIAEEARRYRDRPEADAEWVAQVDAGGAATWWRRHRPLLGQLAQRARTDLREPARRVTSHLAVMRMGTALPPLPMLRPPPSQWTAGGRGDPGGATSEKFLARVRALLDKAEATEFPEEAEALAGKAQELMTRHAIAESMLHANGHDATVGARRVGIDDPYARQKVGLLSAVARANNCEVIYSPGLGSCNVFGVGSDLEVVELLHASLLLQATRAMTSAGTQRDAWGRATTRSFRTSFLAAYAGRIGERLRAAKRTVEAEAEQQYGSALLPVLAARDDAVRAHVESLFPRTRTMRATSISDGRGWSAGIAAADSADLGGRRLRQPRAIDR